MNDTLANIATVKRDLRRLRYALTHRDAAPSNAGFVTGGAPSWEPISLGVEALLADIRREADELEAELRAELGHNYHRLPVLEDALDALATAWQARKTLSGAAGASLTAERVPRAVGLWLARSRLLLGESTAPYRLRWPDGSPVACPVVGQGVHGAYDCAGELWVHRDEHATPREIRCRQNRREHTWHAGPGWLRLGMILGGIPA